MTDADDTTPETSRKRWIKWVVLGGVAAVVLFFAGVFVYTNFINDSPDELDGSDLAAALSETTDALQVSDTTTDSTSTETTPTNDSGTTSEVSSSEVPSNEVPSSEVPSFDGDWVPTTASEFGYRVEDVLAGVNTTAVGRSNEIEGLLTIDGTTASVIDITVQIGNITSDDSRRDGQFSGRIMNAAEFPTAEFRITEPIDFGQIPAGDEQVTATAAGELTLRGVTNPVTFEVIAQTTDGRIGVLGSIPVLFEDYGIDNPSFGVIATEDNGLVEFVLVFDRA